MIRDRFGALRQWIESKSLTGRIGVFVLAIVLMQAYVVIFPATDSISSDALAIVAMLTAIVIALVSIFILVVALLSFGGDLRRAVA